MPLETKPDRRAGEHHVWGELTVPKRFTASFTEDDDLPFNVDLVVELDGDRLVCSSLTCHRKADGSPVTGEAIRQVPVATLVREAAERAASGRHEINKLYKGLQVFGPNPRRQLRERGPVEQTLRAVAFEYRWALLCGEAPTRAVMDRFDIPRATAGRWIAMARKRAFLGAATPRRAGDIQED
jgi:hypothetical protein